MSGNENGGALLSMDPAPTPSPAAETTTPATANNETPAANDGAAPAAAAAAQQSPQDGATPPADGTETATDNSGDGPAEPEGAPETYQFEAPDGLELDPDVLATADPVFRKLNGGRGATQAEAQELVNLFGAEILRQAQAQKDAWEAEVNGWREKTISDPVIGGAGDEDLKRNLGVAKTALDRWGDAELGELLDRFQLGNHPGFVRFCIKAGAQLQEDKSLERGTSATGKDSRLADQLWPNGGADDAAA